MVTGSARSIKKFDIYDAIDDSSDILEHFGGHTFAAGLALKVDKLEDFKNAFENYAQKHLTDDMMIPEIHIDEELDVSDITFGFFKILKQFCSLWSGKYVTTFSIE